GLEPRGAHGPAVLRDAVRRERSLPHRARSGLRDDARGRPEALARGEARRRPERVPHARRLHDRLGPDRRRRRARQRRGRARAARRRVGGLSASEGTVSGRQGSAGALEVLRTVFGYDGFRGHQEAIIGTVLRGGDALVLMPTGGGKSLCYQVPALLLPGMAVVVSPLIALMQDQVAALELLGVRAAYLNSSLGPEEARA